MEWGWGGIHPEKILKPKIRSKENPEAENPKNPKKILPEKILEPKIHQNQILESKIVQKKFWSPKIPGKFHIKNTRIQNLYKKID